MILLNKSFYTFQRFIFCTFQKILKFEAYFRNVIYNKQTINMIDKPAHRQSDGNIHRQVVPVIIVTWTVVFQPHWISLGQLGSVLFIIMRILLSSIAYIHRVVPVGGDIVKQLLRNRGGARESNPQAGWGRDTPHPQGDRHPLAQGSSCCQGGCGTA